MICGEMFQVYPSEDLQLGACAKLLQIKVSKCWEILTKQYKGTRTRALEAFTDKKYSNCSYLVCTEFLFGLFIFNIQTGSFNSHLAKIYIHQDNL